MSLYPPFDAAFSVAALHRAFRRALRRHRNDSEAAAFAVECGPRLCAISRGVLAGTWAPGPMRTFHIREPKPREVAVLPFEDRVVHHALVAALEPVIDARLDPASFACRKRKGLHRCIARAQALAARHRYAVALDVRHYFQELPHATAQGELRQGFGVPAPYLALLGTILRAGAAGRSRGMPIGALTSQFLGNVCLDPVERLLRERFPDTDHVRYMDDLVVFGATRPRLWEAVAAVRVCVAALGLELKDQATVLTPTSEGIGLLGYRVYSGEVCLSRRSRVRLGRGISHAVRLLRAGQGDADRLRASIATRIEHAATGTTLGWRQAVARRVPSA